MTSEVIILGPDLTVHDMGNRSDILGKLIITKDKNIIII